MGLYLGCEHHRSKETVSGLPGVFQVVNWDMNSYLRNTLETYRSLAGPQFKFKKVATPLREDTERIGPRAPFAEGECLECPYCRVRRPPTQFVKGKGGSKGSSGAASVVGKGLPLAGPPVAEPVRGELQSCAAKILMSVLYAARMARYDFLRAVGGLAPMITKWTVECDKKLHHFICYIDSTLAFRQFG